METEPTYMDCWHFIAPLKAGKSMWKKGNRGNRSEKKVQDLQI